MILVPTPSCEGMSSISRATERSCDSADATLVIEADALFGGAPGGRHFLSRVA